MPQSLPIGWCKPACNNRPVIPIAVNGSNLCSYHGGGSRKGLGGQGKAPFET